MFQWLKTQEYSMGSWKPGQIAKEYKNRRINWKVLDKKLNTTNKKDKEEQEGILKLL